MMRKADLFFAALTIITVLFIGCVSTASAETHDGEIISAKAEPDLLVSGQPMSFVITVKNTGTVETDFILDISPLPDFLSDEFSLNAGDTKTLSINMYLDPHHDLRTCYPGSPGPKTYTYRLYWDRCWPASNILLDTVVEERRCFSTGEVSDSDNDNLLYYVEVEQMGTDPDNPDTDGDGKQDDIDKRPTIPEGSISISSSPSGAKMYLDGVYKGKTPLSLEDVISESHTVRVVKEGYYEETKAVSLGAGGTINLDIQLKRVAGSISVSSSPSGASVYLDGHYKGTTPITLTDVPIGSHSVKLTKLGYDDVTKTVSASAGKTARVSETLTGYGSLDISTTPSGVSVYLDGNYKGKTPLSISKVVEGAHSIKLTKSGYGDVTKTAPVSVGKTTHVSENLKEKTTPTPPPVARPTPRPTPTPRPIPVATPPPVTPTPALPVLPISPEYIYLIPIALLLILLPLIFYARGKKKKPVKTPEKPSPPSPEQKVKEEQFTPPISEPITIERAIYDPCKRDFIERALPRMKEWVNRYDPGAYWFAMSIQNNTDKAIEEWGVELETSSALKVEKAIIEGMEYKIELRETHPEPYKNTYVIGVPKEYGIVIPKGGAQRVYFKLRAEKPKTTYEISGVFKSAISGDVPIRAKEFKYLCDTGVSPEAVKAELKKTFSEKDAARLALSFKTIQELDRMCDREAKTDEYLDKLSVLKNYTEGFSNKFSTHMDEFSRFMKEEQLGYLDDEYKGRVRRFCTNLINVWINEFLKG